MHKYLVITRPTVTEVVEERVVVANRVLCADGRRRTWAEIDKAYCRLRRRSGEYDSSLDRNDYTSPGRNTSSEVEVAGTSDNVLVTDLLLPADDVIDATEVTPVLEPVVFPDMSLLSETALARDLEGSSVVDPDVDVTGGGTGAVLPPADF